MKSGVLPDWKIRELIEKGAIPGADINLVNPSSLDLRLSPERHRLIGSFLPLEGQPIREVLESDNFVDHHSTSNDYFAEVSQPYAIKLQESLDLPDSISARFFNKSGRGRIGVSTKGLTDGNPRFDLVRHGYEGSIYAEITATAFPLMLRSGSIAIPQIRFYEGNPEPICGSELELLLREHPILTDDEGRPAYSDDERREMIRTGRLTFTAEIPKDGLIAYRAKRDARHLDLSKSGFYSPGRFFENVNASEGERSVIIHPGDFILINSKQNIRLPPTIAAEIDEYSPALGDMKSHYAGLINASHGYDPENPNIPSHIVFEIRARDVPLMIQDGQPLAQFNLYNMLGAPDEIYMGKRSTGFGDLKSILPSIFNKS